MGTRTNSLAKKYLGGDGLPRYSPLSDEDRVDDQLAELEIQNLQMVGSLLTEAFRRATETHAPTEDAVVAFLEEAHVDGDRARTIARAIGRFHAGDFEAVAYTALPQIEALCRRLLIAIDAPIYRVQRTRTPGQYMGLGAMLPLLRDRGLDESWYRFFRTFLRSPNGWNYRNEALHGFVEDVPAPVAGMVLIGALYLALLQADDGSPNDTSHESTEHED